MNSRYSCLTVVLFPFLTLLMYPPVLITHCRGLLPDATLSISHGLHCLLECLTDLKGRQMNTIPQDDQIIQYLRIKICIIQGSEPIQRKYFGNSKSNVMRLLGSCGGGELSGMITSIGLCGYG